MDLFKELDLAIQKGDISELENIKRRLLLESRDLSVDKSYINSIKGKTLYKNMVKSIKPDCDMSFIEYEKMVSSMLTHCLIDSQITGRNIDDYPVRELYVILGHFISKESGGIEECKKFISERYSQFF